MSRTLVLLSVCVLAGVATLFWPHRKDVAPVRHDGKAGASMDVAPVRGDADLVQRVVALEEQLSRSKAEIERLNQRISHQTARTDSLAAANDTVMRLFAQRTPASGEGGLIAGGAPVPGGAPARSTLTVESVAAAAATGQPLNAPASLGGLEARSGQVLVFRVRGSTAGAVWGVDTYTDDSSIAAAAVHSGALRAGESGTLMLTVRTGAESYPGLVRNGVQSRSFGAWGRGFTIQRLN